MGIPFPNIGQLTVFLADIHVDLGWVTPLTRYVPVHGAAHRSSPLRAVAPMR